MDSFRKEARRWIARTGFFDSVDNSPLIIFRICFGFLMMVESFMSIATGWVKKHFVDPSFTFPYIGFEWLQPLPGNGMYYFYFIMGCLSLVIMIGLYFRIAAFLFFTLWTISYLMQKTDYNNHYYLIILLSFLMILVPAGDYFSVDSRRKKLNILTCPRWCLNIFKFQVAVVYIYAGINKLQGDWLQGLPLNIAITNMSGEDFVGAYLHTPLAKALLTYGGIAFDILIVFFLLNSKTRIYGFISLLFFHLFNSLVFKIGVFPYTMIVLSIFFFPPEKVRALFFKNKLKLSIDQPASSLSSGIHVFQFLLIAIYMASQILLPLRSYLFPGNTNWTEEGHRLSWRMMLRMKSGQIFFKVKDQNKNTWIVHPEEYLTASHSAELACHPDMIWQFSQYLKKDFSEKKKIKPEIYAHSYVSLNGRPQQLFIDTLVNLGEVRWDPWKHSEWILPMK